MISHGSVKGDNRKLKSKRYTNLLPVECDGDEGEDADVDAEDLHGGAELAHEGGQVPPLQQRRPELERDRQHRDRHVRW